MAKTELAKPFYRSSTLWLNVVGIAVIAIQFVVDKNLVDADLQALLLAVLNLANRFRTTGPVTMKI